MSGSGPALLTSLDRWLQAEPSVQAAVLFGSQVRPGGSAAAADGWSDVDLHIITSAAGKLETADWAALLPDRRLCLKAVRPASGGVRKVTLVFADGEADLVLVPAGKLRVAAFAMQLGLHRKIGVLTTALNNLATIMGGGYRFLKGEPAWGGFYARVVAEMPGFRVSNDEARQLAAVALCDGLWVLQKIERGEFVAAQRILHRTVMEANVVLLHELRLRRGEATFQQARRVERLVTPGQLETLHVSARLDGAELRAAAWRTLTGLKTLMREIDAAWVVPPGMDALLAPHAPR